MGPDSRRTARYESFQDLVDAYSAFLAVLADETPDTVDISWIGAEEPGEGVGTRFMHEAKAYADQTGKRLIATSVETPAFFASLGFMQPGPDRTWVYDPPRMSKSSSRYFHYAPASEREAIEREGLRPARELFPEEFDPDAYPGMGDDWYTWFHQMPEPPRQLDHTDMWELIAPEAYRDFEPDPDPLDTIKHPYYRGPRIAPEHLRRVSHTRTCPTCGDPLKGEHDTFCPRCQWSEHDVNLDADPLSNPPDPTKDLHRGIQAGFTSTIPSHRWTGQWLTAVEDSP